MFIRIALLNRQVNKVKTESLVLINVRITVAQASALARARREGYRASWIVRAALDEKLNEMKKAGKIT